MPEPSWITYAEAVALEGLSDVVGLDADPGFTAAVDAAAAYVEGRRDDVVYTDAATAGPMIRLGTARLAHRWFERRANPLGVAQFSEFGGEILRSDPDIATLLGIGTHRPFVFGAGRCIPEVVVP